MKVIKRDGRVVLFNRDKIRNAVLSAFSEVDGEESTYAKNKANEICLYIESMDKDMTVEEIQDLVEKKLMDSNRKDVAKAYIIYRQKRNDARKNTIDDVIKGIVDTSNDYWAHENSNKDIALCTTQRDYIAGAVSTDISKRQLLPTDVIEAHNQGLIHFHDMDYFIQPIHNCFHGKTRFITSEGIKAFDEFSDYSKVMVLDKDGIWREATVRNYGKQPMKEVVFSTPKMKKTVICTSNHRWILKDGTVTTELKVGDILTPLTDNTVRGELNTRRECEMFTLGFLIGDGCDHIGHNHHQIRLCNSKTMYSKYFESVGYKISNIPNSNDLLATKRGCIKQDFLNKEGWKYLSPEDKRYLFYGLYCADGATGSNKLCTTDVRVSNMIEAISVYAGYHISSKTTEIRDTQYKENSELVAFHFIISQPINLCWKVSSIKDYHGKSEYSAWCVEEPVTHSFTLEGGMVTGNCDLINLEDMLQNGTVISKTKIDKPHKFSTACNIATQIIAQVASSQYGGQSISVAHLSPFVQSSREKYKRDYPNLNDEMIEKMVSEDIKAGVQTLQYQILTLMTTNGQTPFITVYMNLAEIEEGPGRKDLALVIEEILNQRIQGIKNEAGVWITPAFPKLIYALDDMNAPTGSPYFYLTQLAAKCTAKRMVPDYISNKVQRELKEGDTYTCINKACA